MSEHAAKPSFFNNMYVIAPTFLAFVGGVVALAVWFGPNDRSARACHQTEDDYVKGEQGAGSYNRLRHLGYNFDACLDGCEDEGDAYSCQNVAKIYAEGKGLFYEDGVDLEQAAKYAQRACELEGRTPCIMPARYLCLHDPAACEVRCRGGAGLDCVSLAKHDEARALELHELACETGIDESCAKAVELLCASRPSDCADRCNAGEAAMCFMLGEHFNRGTGEVAKNPQKATDFKRRACQLDASVNLDCSKIMNEAQIELIDSAPERPL